MFESRMPLYMILCALVLVAWTAVFPAATPPPALSWSLAGLIALYVVAAVVFRAGRSEQPVTSTLDEAARLNAARIAAPRSTPPGERR
jgi:hypothetical protein